ncbi:Rha family transcriptional regulator [uncultured Oscillibacter sp.]|uniref:Rha family transcriptional regulator n=1 Tax=uncultured Oscillibacter sp. TaxID=876091 RepID=UPI0034210AB6
MVEIKKFGHEERAICTSLDVAETFGKEHKHVLRDIRELGCSAGFNQSNFGPISYTDSMNRQQEAIVMTRDGFTLLVMGYTGELAMKFKEAYIKQFNAMEAALRGKLIEREKGIAVRQALTKALQQSNEDARMHGHAYSTYTNCIYKALFDMNANQLREKFGISKKENLRDCFTQEEMRAVQSMECLVSGLVDCGWDYHQIKTFIQQNNTQRILAA